MSRPDVCMLCGKEVEDPEKDLCPDLVCRDCHVSISFEACCDGTWQEEHPVFRRIVKE